MTFDEAFDALMEQRATRMHSDEAGAAFQSLSTIDFWFFRAELESVRREVVEAFLLATDWEID
jgi:hypothetical protein